MLFDFLRFLQLLVKEFSSTVNAQKNKVNQLEDDTTSLADDISSLKKLNDIRAADADKALDDFDKTHKRAKDLESDIQKMLKKIQGKNQHQSSMIVIFKDPPLSSFELF